MRKNCRWKLIDWNVPSILSISIIGTKNSQPKKAGAKRVFLTSILKSTHAFLNFYEIRYDRCVELNNKFWINDNVIKKLQSF